jgi:rhamnulokinase
LIDLHKKCWNKEVFKKLGLPMGIMPDILMPGEKLGAVFPEILKETSLERCRLSTTASHDTASAYFAAPVEEEKSSLIISSGTWSLVGKLVKEPIITDYSHKMRFTNEGGVGNIRFLRNVMGTWLIQELKKNWEEEDNRKFTWDEIVKMAESAKEFTAFIDPDHNSFFNPRNMESAIKNFCADTGQAIPEKRGEILRICYECLALKCKTVNNEIEKASGGSNKAVYVVGGGAKNKLLNSFISSACGLPLYAGPVEATAAGNILVQAVSLGLADSAAVCRKLVRNSFEITEYNPEDRVKWQKKHKNFLEILGKSGIVDQAR